jgi:hypothetical protein
MNSEGPGRSRSGLSAPAGVVAMLAVVAIVLGAGFLLTRQLLQAGVSSTTTEASSPDRLLLGRSEPQAAATPTAPVAKGGSTASSEPAETPGGSAHQDLRWRRAAVRGRGDRDIRVGEPRADSRARRCPYRRRERASAAVERSRRKRRQYVAARLRRRFRKWRNPFEPDSSTPGRPALERDARWRTYPGWPGGRGLGRS